MIPVSNRLEKVAASAFTETGVIQLIRLADRWIVRKGDRSLGNWPTVDQDECFKFFIKVITAEDAGEDSRLIMLSVKTWRDLTTKLSARN